MCAELVRQRGLIGTSCDGSDPVAQLVRILHTEMTQSTDALDRDQRVGFGLQLLQCVVGGDAGAQQRGGIDRLQGVGNADKPAGAGVDRLGVSTIRVRAGSRLICAVDEIPVAAPDTHAAVTAQKANANAVTDAPSGYLLSEGIDDADDLMPRYHRLTGIGTQALDREHIAVADTATVHTKPHMTRLRVEQLTLHQFELPPPGDLKGAIGRHAKPPSVCST